MCCRCSVTVLQLNDFLMASPETTACAISQSFSSESVVTRFAFAPDSPDTDAAIATDSMAVRPPTTPDRNLSRASYCTCTQLGPKWAKSTKSHKYINFTLVADSAECHATQIWLSDTTTVQLTSTRFATVRIILHCSLILYDSFIIAWHEANYKSQTTPILTHARTLRECILITFATVLSKMQR